VALRAGDEAPAQVQTTLERMADMVDALRQGRWHGATGKPIRHVINLGIGGSDLGPHLAVQALAPADAPLQVDFVAGLDAAEMQRAFDRADPESTLFVVSSKSFTTIETLSNARSALAWLRSGLGEAVDLAPHLVAVTNRPKAAQAAGISAANTLPLPEWVGGRFSLWSAVGFPLACAIGMDGFRRLLTGARCADRHFFEAPFEANIPVLMALLGLWNTRWLGAASHAVLPYSYRLRELATYLQQLDMESNGKSVTAEGAPVDGDTAPILWGGAEPMGQHAFHQMLYQGTRCVPMDVIVIAGGSERERALFDNALAQSAALMHGKTLAEARDELAARGLANDEVKRLAPHLVCHGNQPSSTFLLPELNPYRLGQVLALYEHKVFTQGWLWGINSFDQFGVEFGKQMARAIVGGDDAAVLDASTRGLLRARERLLRS
jgi:glucose-6-phosphate isomerase